METTTNLNAETTLVPASDLQRHPRNPRRGVIPTIVESIKTNGWYGTVIAQRSTGYVLAGNHRLQAAVQLGIELIPVTWLDVDDAQATRILLADNRTSDLATFDDAALATLLREIATEGPLLGTGYTLDDLANFTPADPEDETTDTSEAELQNADRYQTTWNVQPGQTWTIPSATHPALTHTITCGDSTDPTVVNQATQGTQTDMVFTDPPYGVDYVGDKRTPRDKLLNDALGLDGTRALVAAAAAAWPLKPGAAFYLCSPAGDLETSFRNALINAGYQLRQGLVWIKHQLVLGKSDYHYRHETILYGWRDGAAHYFRTERTEDSILNQTTDARLRDLDTPALKAIIRELRRELRDTTWHEDRPGRSPDHPTTKPLGLITKALRNSTTTGNTVFDGFGGSGSTLLPAELTARQAHLIELEPRFCAVQLERARNAGLHPALQE